MGREHHQLVEIIGLNLMQVDCFDVLLDNIQLVQPHPGSPVGEFLLFLPALLHHVILALFEVMDKHREVHFRDAFFLRAEKAQIGSLALANFESGVFAVFDEFRPPLHGKLDDLLPASPAFIKLQRVPVLARCFHGVVVLALIGNQVHPPIDMGELLQLVLAELDACFVGFVVLGQGRAEVV